VVVDVNLSSVVKVLDFFIRFGVLKSLFGTFRILKFDKTIVGFNLDLIFQNFVVLFGFVNSDLTGIDFSKTGEGLNKLLHSHLFFQILCEKVSVVGKFAVLLLSAGFILEPVNVKFGSIFKKIRVLVFGHDVFSMNLIT